MNNENSHDVRAESVVTTAHDRIDRLRAELAYQRRLIEELAHRVSCLERDREASSADHEAEHERCTLHSDLTNLRDLLATMGAHLHSVAQID